MGEIRDGATTRRALRDDAQALAAVENTLPARMRSSTAETIHHAHGWPTSAAETPIIIDTDIGGDPDDALAIAAAARCLPQLALVVTSDETGPDQGYGQRAQFARALLDGLGRPDVPVVAGHSQGHTRYWCVADLIPRGAPPPDTDVHEAVRDVCTRGGPVRWIGMGPLSNLATVLRGTNVGRQLRITQMGGALRYRNPERGEHNMRLDVAAAEEVFKRVSVDQLPMELVTSEVTFTPELEVTTGSPIYRRVAAHPAQWAQLLRRHMDAWFSEFHPGTIQHDALTLSAACDLPFVNSERVAVAVDERGRTREDDAGAAVWLSSSAEYAAFMRWLEASLDPARTDRPVAVAG